MRFLEVLLLFGLFLVLANAQNGGTTGDEPMFEDTADIAAGDAVTGDENEEDVKRQIFPPRPPYRPTVTVPLAIPGNMNSPFFRLCYCFRRRCYG